MKKFIICWFFCLKKAIHKLTFDWFDGIIGRIFRSKCCPFYGFTGFIRNSECLFIYLFYLLNRLAGSHWARILHKISLNSALNEIMWRGCIIHSYTWANANRRPFRFELRISSGKKNALIHMQIMPNGWAKSTLVLHSNEHYENNVHCAVCIVCAHKCDG